MDQACPNFYPYLPNIEVINTGQHLTGEIFSPTRNTLDAAIVLLKDLTGRGTKARVQIYNVTTASVAGLVVEKDIAVTTTSIYGGWYIVDFDDIALPGGVYSLIVRSVHNDTPVGWAEVGGDCAPYSYPKIDGVTDMSKDFAFSIYTYDSANPPAPTANSGDDETIDDQVADALEQAETDNQNAPSSSISPDTDMATQSGSSGNSLESSPDANQASELGYKLISDEDYRALIDEIMADLEAHQPTVWEKILNIFLWIILSPIFSILAPIIFIIILVLVIVAIVNHRKRKNAAQPQEKQS